MRIPSRRLLSLSLGVAIVAAPAGCTAEAWCATRQECDRALEDDSQGVCVEDLKGEVDALRANEEEECHVLADALLALRACEAQLDCDDFEEGRKCDDERDDFRDADEDATVRAEPLCSSRQ